MSAVFTAEAIASRVGCSPRAVRKRLAGAQDFIAGYSESQGGPKAILYKPEVVEVYWPGVQSLTPREKEPKLRIRKERTDKGRPRGKDELLVEMAVERAFTLYMSSAVPDVRGACRAAIRELMAAARAGELPLPADRAVEEVEKIAQSEWLYKKWICRNDAHFTGPYWTESWKASWEGKYGVHRRAMKSAHVRYTTWQILENDFNCGAGRGFCRFIMLDDRQSDVRTGEDKRQASAIYVWCILTGALLWVESCETVTAEAYIRAILSTVMIYGLPADPPVLFMENAKAAVAGRVQGAIRSLYTPEQWNDPGRLHKEFFHTDSWIVRNVASIPQGFGKAFGERMFRRLKEAYDAQLYPLAFQGGNRNETVSLVRSANPVFRDVPSVEDYFRRIMAFGYTEYMDAPRESLVAWARAHSAEPTVRSMVDYYRPAERRMPTPKQFAYLLYYAQQNLPKPSKMSMPGAITMQVGGRRYNLRAVELYAPELAPKKFQAIPLPGDPSKCAVYRYEKTGVQFICIAEDFTATTAADAIRMNRSSRQMREHYFDAVDSQVEARLVRRPEDVVADRRRALDSVDPKMELPVWTASVNGEVVQSDRIVGELCSDEVYGEECDDSDIADELDELI